MVNKLEIYMERYRPDFQKVMPKGLSPDRLLRLALTEIRKNPRLADCTEGSLLGGILNAASLGITIGDGLNQAYLVPRRNNKLNVVEAQFQIGYQGLITLARRSGMTIDAEVVYEGDVFDYERGTTKFLRHKQTFKSRVFKYVWAMATYDTGEHQFIIMDNNDIERAKSFSDSRNSPHSPWVKHFEAMAKKTAIKGLCKLLPINVEEKGISSGIVMDNTIRIGASEPAHDYDEHGVVFEAEDDIPNFPVISPQSEDINPQGVPVDVEEPPKKRGRPKKDSQEMNQEAML